MSIIADVEFPAHRGVGATKDVPKLVRVIAGPKVVQKMNMRTELPMVVPAVGISLIEIEKVPSLRVMEHVRDEETTVFDDLANLPNERLAFPFSKCLKIVVGGF